MNKIEEWHRLNFKKTKKLKENRHENERIAIGSCEHTHP
jgi:hypothetical protein